MKKILLLAIMAACINQAGLAQKLIIGSKVPDFKGVKWQSTAPVQGKAKLVEFYSATNPTSAKLYSNLAGIQSKYSNIEIIVLYREDNPEMSQLASRDGSKYLFGYDANGTTYDALGVKFLPFTMLIDSKGNLLWQGNLSNINDQVLQKTQ